MGKKVIIIEIKLKSIKNIQVILDYTESIPFRFLFNLEIVDELL